MGLHKFSQFVFLTALLLLGNVSQCWGQARSYTTITAVEVTALSNGVQVRIKADGILQYRDADANGSQMHLYFPNARNGTGKNFFNVDRYPVSYIQLSTPQGAASGIGLNFDIRNLASTSGSVSTGADGQSVLFTIQSDRTVESSGRNSGNNETGSSSTPNAGDTATEVLFEDGTVSIRAVRADIHELVAAIAQKSGLSVSVDDNVRRTVSLNLQRMEPAAAVGSIATATGLAISRVNNIFMMSEGVPTDLATYNLSGTASFRMQNIQAGTASGLLPNFLYSYVKVNAEQNAVVVTAPQQMLAKIGSDLQKIDVPSPQILIEAIAVELSDSSDLDIGLQVGNPNPLRQSFADTTTGTIAYNSIGRLSDRFQATLRALELQGKARVRARPQMAVVNGRTANIFIGAQRFILTQFTQNGQNQSRIQAVDVGVKLQVTPLTGGNGEITTRILPEVSNITELDLLSGLPVLSSRRAETTVRVKDGETIAIGGLTLDQEQRTNRKIPFFGDLPLIGKLFHGTKRSSVKTELVVFITPHIIAQPAISATP
jgi:type II secretory pathway component GspD/PulD (secretin)